MRTKIFDLLLCDLSVVKKLPGFVAAGDQKIFRNRLGLRLWFNVGPF